MSAARSRGLRASPFSLPVKRHYAGLGRSDCAPAAQACAAGRMAESRSGECRWSGCPAGALLAVPRAALGLRLARDRAYPSPAQSTRSQAKRGQHQGGAGRIARAMRRSDCVRPECREL